MLISHASIDPAKTLGLRSSVSGRSEHFLLTSCDFFFLLPQYLSLLLVYAGLFM